MKQIGGSTQRLSPIGGCTYTQVSLVMVRAPNENIHTFRGVQCKRSSPEDIVSDAIKVRSQMPEALLKSTVRATAKKHYFELILIDQKTGTCWTCINLASYMRWTN